MSEEVSRPPASTPTRRYRWPWFLLAAVLLGVILAALWLSKEIERTRSLRDWDRSEPQSPTNALQ